MITYLLTRTRLISVSRVNSRSSALTSTSQSLWTVVAGVHGSGHTCIYQ